MHLRSLRSVSPDYLEPVVIEVAAGNIKFSPPSQSPPTQQPWFKAHMYRINNYYYLESLHLSHLTCFLILRLRFTKQANIAALEARPEAESLEQKLHTEAYLAIKYREVISLLLQQEVSDHRREMPELAPTKIRRIIF